MLDAATARELIQLREIAFGSKPTEYENILRVIFTYAANYGAASIPFRNVIIEPHTENLLKLGFGVHQEDTMTIITIP